MKNLTEREPKMYEQDPIKRAEQKHDRLYAQGNMTERKLEMLERRVKQLSGKRPRNPKLEEYFKAKNAKFKPDNWRPKNVLNRADVQKKFVVWYFNKFKTTPPDFEGDINVIA